MRFIRPEDVQIQLPPDWDHQVSTAKKAAIEKVRLAARTARTADLSPVDTKKAICAAAHKAVSECNIVWAKAKDAFASVSFDKCYYCECKQERADFHIDHFRPKNRITGEKDHPGYWWLALEWRNFRLACTFCNCVRDDFEMGASGGKGNRFPILPARARMRRPLDLRDFPKLIDPFLSHEVEWLTFKRNGLPEPVSKDKDSIEYKRTEKL